MSGLFYGLEIAKSGLYVSQAVMNITGHNIANADTDGYSRQRIVAESVEPSTMSFRFSKVLGNTVGGGATIQTTDQIRNEFVDRQYQKEYADAQKWATETEQMEYIESLFNETSDNSISSTLASFFDSIGELSKNPASEELRTNVQQNAIKLTETFNHYYEQLTELQDMQNESMKVSVDRINDLTTSIASYNKEIYTYELSGEKANDLRDKRNLLLDQLSGIVNIEYSEDSDGQLTVTVNDKELVNHTDVTLLEVEQDQTGVVSGTADYYGIYYEGTSDEFDYSSGELAAYRLLRDGDSVDSIGIPRILDNLNTLARSIAKEMNTVNAGGYTMPYGANESRQGVKFFDVPSNDYNLVTAETFGLSAELKESAYNIACSDQKIDDPTSENNQRGNNKNALKMVALSTRVDVPDVSNFENYLKSIIVEVSIESAHCQKMDDGQMSVMDNLINRRESISGVSIDEEMIQMIKAQNAYSAASRMITAIDEALDTLINKTGMVGR